MRRRPLEQTLPDISLAQQQLNVLLGPLARGQRLEKHHNLLEIQRQVAALRDLTARIDNTLAKHLEKESVEFIQFSFRWMNCLLMREISVKNTIRMWDTYMLCLTLTHCRIDIPN